MSLKENVLEKLADKDTSLREVWIAAAGSVKEAHEKVQDITDLVVSERSVRRWLKDDELI